MCVNVKSASECILCDSSSKYLRCLKCSHSKCSPTNNYLESIQNTCKILFLTPEDSKICNKCIGQLKIVETFMRNVEKAKEKLNHIGEPSDGENLLKKFDVANMDSEINVGDVTIRKTKCEQINNYDLEKDIFIIDMDEFDQENENLIKFSRQPSGNFYIRPLTEQARRRLIKMLELKKKSKVDNNIHEIKYYDLRDVTITRYGSHRNALTNEGTNINNNDDTPLKRVLKRKLRKRNATCTEYPMCGDKYSDYDKLLSHYETHTNTDHLCYKCGKVFSSSSKLLSHLKSHNVTTMTHLCPLCPKKYKTKNIVMQHVKRHHRKMKLYSCVPCNLRFNYLASRRQHAYEIHGVETFNCVCAQCGKLFFRNADLRKHELLVHLEQKNYVCMLCKKAFFTSKILQDHMVTHTGVKDYYCDKCGKAFSRLSSLREHVKIHLNIKEHKCRVCHREFVQKITLKTHLRTHAFVV